MISKISAIVAAAVMLASVSVASAQTAYAPSFHNSYHNQDTRNLRYGHANDPHLTPMPGRCGRILRRTKFCARCSGSFPRTISRMAAAPSAAIRLFAGQA